MNEPTARHHNALAAAMVLGFVPKGYKCKKSKTKCQRKRRPASNRERARGVGKIVFRWNGYSYRQASRHKFILTGPAPELHDLKAGTITPITKDSKIGRKYAK